MVRTQRWKKGEVLRGLFIVWVAALLMRHMLQRMDDEKEDQELQKNIESYIRRSLELPVAAYPSWVHGVWVRIPADVVAAGRTVDVVQKFLQQGIPVGVVFVEHGATLFTQNMSNTRRFKHLVEQLHAMNLRVVTSVDSFVRRGTTEYESCKAHSMLLLTYTNDSVQWKHAVDDVTTRTEDGGLLDLTNVEAVRWYRRRLEQVLQTGVNGVWNEAMDGVLSSAFGRGVHGRGGFVDSALYANDYYYQTFDYGRERNGFDFITSFLPVDSLSRETVLRPFGPTDISFATLVRNHPFSFSGLEDAVTSIEKSVGKGYINVGVEPRGPLKGGVDVALRWVQLAAMCPLTCIPYTLLEYVKLHFPSDFEMFLSEVGKLTLLHETLRPYYFSLGSLTFFHQFRQRNASPMKVPAPFVMSMVDVQTKGPWRGFSIGAELFFVPVTRTVIGKDGDLRARQTFSVTFPVELGPWIPHAASQLPFAVYAAGSEAQFTVNVTQLLLFQRGGAVIPVREPSLPGVVTFRVQYPQLSLYPEKYIPNDIVDGDNVNAAKRELAIFYSESGKRHFVWFTVEQDVGELLWLNVNGTVSGMKTIVCVSGADAIISDGIVDDGYGRATSTHEFHELVAMGTSAVFSASGEACFYTSLMAVDSVARIGPLKGILQ
ncbi:glycosyl hydrolase, family 31 protein [Trypanosoma grayi]|uniref:glycosyl hydrolase, family 31 protein n=1 Tax=Trypanosoma grayi TaxID=71804 RepID=UPI0004F466D2|nr:glycosyl hydrolase, family 31 protein [Trypanosoma grayi]KEG06895.1 glycosyl hydrolase, family 31 protein [Trypanosoma grayi]